jgi:hypothetical protein
MEFRNYVAMLIGGAVALLIFELCVFISPSNRLLAELLEKLFEITRLDHQMLIMNFFCIQIDFISLRRFRLSLTDQIAGIA